jgi:hypothetical protein
MTTGHRSETSSNKGLSQDIGRRPRLTQYAAFLKGGETKTDYERAIESI